MTQLPAMAANQAPDPDDLDFANRSLSEALHKSFVVLKLLMLVLVVLYFASGWFSVRPGEAGVVYRYGRIVGAIGGEEQAVLGPGWHWSFPYPIDRWQTVSTAERELPVEFMFERTEEENASGDLEFKYGNLSPARDDYLITGDVNILHASLQLKYRIANVVDYLTNIRPAPDRLATSRSPLYRRYPEYTIMSSLLRDAVIETAAGRRALDIRGNLQDEFLLAVTQCVIGKLGALASAGHPLGIAVDPNNGVIAPKVSRIEAIMPPRQTQEVFNQVSGAQQQKSIAITQAASDAQELLFKTAGTEYEPLAKAIDREFDLIHKVSAAESALKGSADSPELIKLRGELAKASETSELLLTKASGAVQGILQEAQINRDQAIKEIKGDFDQLTSLLPEYRRNPEIFISRLQDETLATVLGNKEVTKMFLPTEQDGRIWLQIPRSNPIVPKEKEKEGYEKFSPYDVKVKPLLK